MLVDERCPQATDSVRQCRGGSVASDVSRFRLEDHGLLVEAVQQAAGEDEALDRI
jgi:hypothetical protein